MLITIPPLFHLTKQSRHVFYYPHGITNIARVLFIAVPLFDDPSFSLLLLKKMGKQWSDPLFTWLTEQTVSEKAFRAFMKHTLTIATQYPSLYITLCPRISVIIDRASLKTVITVLEFQALYVVFPLTPQFVVAFSITLVTSANIDRF
jgi:hypothetical protein